MEVAGEQHVVDVVTRAVVKFPHVERSRFEVVEVGFDLQTLQDALLHQVNVPDLVPAQTERRRRGEELTQLFHAFLKANFMSRRSAH